MNEIRKKQKKHYNLMRAVVIIGAVFLFIYIGAKPFITEFNETLSVVTNYICDAVVIAVLAMLFSYYSKYGKCQAFLDHIENEINDAGCYITSRTDSTVNSYCESVFEDLKSCGYSVSNKLEITELDFYARAMKKKEFFYIADFDELDKNDVIAYLDAVTYDITVNNLKKSGSGVLCLVCNKADDDAVSLSKMISAYGKKEQLKIAMAIVEISSRKVYFLGNEQTKCQQLIANFVMNCELPIKEQYICRERLPFQDEINEKMKSFSTNDYKNGKFFVH